MLTYKTVFWITLATSRRVSSIHALNGLDADIGFCRKREASSVTLSFRPDFRAKNQKAEDQSPTVVVPALSNILSHDDDLVLCPVTALRIYLKRTSPFRGAKRRLFISLNPQKSSDIAVGSIARWIVLTVKLAYDNSDTPVNQPMRAHETRAASASLALTRGVTMGQIMSAAYWKSESTFTSFYLRHFSSLRSDNAFRINRVVVAQAATSL